MPRNSKWTGNILRERSIIEQNMFYCLWDGKFNIHSDLNKANKHDLLLRSLHSASTILRYETVGRYTHQSSGIMVSVVWHNPQCSVNPLPFRFLINTNMAIRPVCQRSSSYSLRPEYPSNLTIVCSFRVLVPNSSRDLNHAYCSTLIRKVLLWLLQKNSEQKLVYSVSIKLSKFSLIHSIKHASIPPIIALKADILPNRNTHFPFPPTH